MNNKRNGFALVYGLIILMFVTAIGTAILFMVQIDRTSAAHYQNSQVALQAAQAALKAVEGQLACAPDSSIAILRKYLTNSDYKWFFGKTISDASSTQTIDLGSGSKYSAKILDFDSTNSLLMVEATGYDGLGSKKRITAMYKLSGLSAPTSLKSIRSYGLFLNGSLENCNAPINIKGDVYLSLNGKTDPQHFQGGGTIDGNLITGISTNVFDISALGLVVKGKAYMRCPMTCNGTFTVKDKSGFEKQINSLNAEMQLFGDAFFDFNLDSTWNSDVNLNNHAITYNPTINPAKFVNTTSSTSSASIDVAAALGLTTTNEAIDTIKWPASGNPENISGTITAGDVQSLWNSQNTSGKLYMGEWLILKLNGPVNMIGNGTVTGKIMWMTGDYTITVNGNWYDCAPTSNTFIYVNGNGHLEGMGIPNNKSFRGFIYVNTTYSNPMTYQFGNNTKFNGAIEHASGSFDLNSGTLNIDFSEGSSGQDAVQELVKINVLVPAN